LGCGSGPIARRSTPERLRSPGATPGCVRNCDCMSHSGTTR